jgi:hydroxymethylglutaryl-CoA lyase
VTYDHDEKVTNVTLREYGQNIPSAYLHIFTPEIRIKIALGLVEAGFTEIEILSCVHTKVAPAMSEVAIREIAEGLGKIEGVQLITLVPNKAGYRHFLSDGLGPDGYNHTMGIFFSAVEAHNLANVGRPITETVEEYTGILKDAVPRGIRTVGYVSAAFGYIPSENHAVIRPPIDRVNDYIGLLFGLGVSAVTLSDLQGVADQHETREFFDVLLTRRKGRDIERLGYHPHHVDGNRAIANSRIACDLGIRRFDSSLGGTGGCVTGAPGNQPTEGLIHAFHSSGIETGIDEQKVVSLGKTVQTELYTKITLTKHKGERA